MNLQSFLFIALIPIAEPVSPLSSRSHTGLLFMAAAPKTSAIQDAPSSRYARVSKVPSIACRPRTLLSIETAGSLLARGLEKQQVEYSRGEREKERRRKNAKYHSEWVARQDPSRLKERRKAYQAAYKERKGPRPKTAKRVRKGAARQDHSQLMERRKAYQAAYRKREGTKQKGAQYVREWIARQDPSQLKEHRRAYQAAYRESKRKEDPKGFKKHSRAASAKHRERSKPKALPKQSAANEEHRRSKERNNAAAREYYNLLKDIPEFKEKHRLKSKAWRAKKKLEAMRDKNRSLQEELQPPGRTLQGQTSDTVTGKGMSAAEQG